MARRWVLLVIDDSAAQTEVELIARELGFHVTVAPNAAQGAEQAKDLKPVLVVSNKPAPEGGYAGRPFLLLSAPIDPEGLKAQIASLAKEPAAETPPPPVEAAPPPPEVEHWLVVASGDPATQPIVELALLGQGLESVTVADAGRIAAQVESLKPDLLLCDLDLPGLTDGAAVLRDLRRNPGTSALRLIFIGARDADEALAPLLAADPAARFHKKPLDADTLRGTIASLLAGEPAPAPEPAAPEAVRTAPPQRGTALILEADPVTRALIESVLREIGLKASAGDPASALTAAADLKPALIVSDLAVPGAVAVLTDMRLDPLLREIPFLFTADMPVEKAMGLVPWGDDTVRFAKKPLDLAKVKALAAEMTGWQA